MNISSTVQLRQVFQDFLKKAVKKPSVPWPSVKGFDRYFLQITDRQDMQPLIYFYQGKKPFWETWPGKVRMEIAAEAKRQAVLELINREQDRQVIAALAGEKIPAIVFKGTAVGHLFYPDASLRPRCDTDLLILEQDSPKVQKVMTRLGYSKENLLAGRIHQQFMFVKEDAVDNYTYDFHIKISNPRTFSNALTFEEMMPETLALPRIGPAARGTGLLHSLLIACIHRVAHHHNTARLIWLYDIHLLAERLSLAEWEDFLALAARKRIRAVCSEGLRLAQAHFGTSLPQGILEPEKESGDGEEEMSADFLKVSESVSVFRLFFLEWKALPNWKERLGLLKEHLFPPSEYMVKKYPFSRRFWLPFLYAFRLLYGAGKSACRGFQNRFSSL